MRGVILNFDEISDCTELYDSKPRSICSAFIVLVAFFLTCVILCLCFFKIDVVVKGTGVVKNENNVIEKISLVSGMVLTCYVKDNQLVKKGDLIYEVNHDDIDEELKYYNRLLDDYNMHIAALETYLLSIENRTNNMESLNDNPYYSKYIIKYYLYINNYNTYKKNNEYSNVQKQILENLLLEEKNSINLEMSEIYNSKDEAERQIKNLSKKREYYFCYSDIDGYIDFEIDLNNVNYIMTGNKVLQIIPKDKGNYYMEIYVNSQNIVGVKKGMKVEYESSVLMPEKGIKNVSGDIYFISPKAEIHDNVGNSYYSIKANIKNDNNITIKEDMNCPVNIVVGRESIFKHFLRKINIID